MAIFFITFNSVIMKHGDKVYTTLSLPYLVRILMDELYVFMKKMPYKYRWYYYQLVNGPQHKT